jgi:hypothetical protein
MEQPCSTGRTFRRHPQVRPPAIASLQKKVMKSRYFYIGATFAVTEIDGVRVIGQEVCDFIQKVPGMKSHPLNSVCWTHVITVSTMSVFRPGSTSPSAILFDAWESFTRRSSKADESIRSIRPDLAAAVNECIDAAGREWEPYWQRRLLSVRLTTSWYLIELMISFASGSKVWLGFLGPIQSQRLCCNGPVSESAELS